MRHAVAVGSVLAVLVTLPGVGSGQTPASRQAVAEAHRLAQESFRPMVPHVYYTPAIGPWGVQWVPYSVMLGAQPPVGQQQIQTGPGAWVSRPIYADQLQPAAAAVAVAAPQLPVAPAVPAQEEFAPTSVEALASAGEAALRAGNLTAALELVDRALAADSQFGYASLVRSQVLFALARFSESVTALNAAMELMPADVWMQPVTNYASTFGPDTRQSTRRYVTWLQVLEATVRTEPANVPARLLLGYHYAALGFSEAAMAHLQEVVRLEPQNATATRLLERLGIQPPPAAPQPGQRQF